MNHLTAQTRGQRLEGGGRAFAGALDQRTPRAVANPRREGGHHLTRASHIPLQHPVGRRVVEIAQRGGDLAHEPADRAQHARRQVAVAVQNLAF